MSEPMRFPALSKHTFVKHAFICRVPGVETAVERELALQRLAPFHDALRCQEGMGEFVTAEQVHGAGVALVTATTRGTQPQVDALVTAEPGICLGIYVADCCAVYLLDPVRRCIGLAHSGAKGTRLGIVPATLELMTGQCGTDPADLIVQLSPCIRPPLYEVDFAAEIIRQCQQAGVRQIHDSGLCTGSDLERFYSYRVEQGRTGRMLALLELAGEGEAPAEP